MRSLFVLTVFILVGVLALKDGTKTKFTKNPINLENPNGVDGSFVNGYTGFIQVDKNVI